MIPTKFKYKLPKTLSWPLGAAAVTAGLADAPHVDEFSLWFMNSPVWRASGFQRTLREGNPYAVLVAEYSPPTRGSKAMDALGMNDAKWQVYINPVPRGWRSAVATLLREQGLPAVADWLRAYTGEGWEAQYHRIELVYSPSEGTLSKQTNNGV